jgi:hypothetical protein
MAPAADARTPFHRSHSTPDLLSALPKPLPPVTNSQPLRRANTFKELPSLPAFDVPSFDIAEFESALRFERDSKELRRPTVQEKVVEIRADTPPLVDIVAEDERSGRTSSMIDRPRSWLPSSKSSPDVRAAQNERPKSLAKDSVGSTPAPVPAPDDPRPGSLERSRTVESFGSRVRGRPLLPAKQIGRMAQKANRASEVGLTLVDAWPPMNRTAPALQSHPAANLAP